MINVNPTTVIKMIGLITGLLKHAQDIPKPVQIDSYISTPETNKSDYFVVILKAAFKTKDDAQKFKDFDTKLDAAIGEI